MFVVAPISRKHNPKTGEFTTFFAVVFEDDEQAIATSAIASEGSRDAAQKVADALNAALKKAQGK